MIAAAIKGMFSPPGQRPRNELCEELEGAGVDFNTRNPDDWQSFLSEHAGSHSLAGIRVTHEDALCFAPIVRALKILGGDTACSPLHVCKTEVDPGDDVIDEDHAIDGILSEQWNENTSAAAGWERYIQEANLFGSAFAWIERANDRQSALEELDWGTPIGLYHLNPLCTVPRIANETGYLGNEHDGFLYVQKGQPYYETTVGGKTAFLAWNEVIEYTPLRVMRQLNMLKLIRNVVGLALAAQGFQSKFFANGAQAGGFISVPAESTPASALNLQKQLKKRQTTDSWFKLHVLRDGAKFQQLTIDPKSSDMNSIDDRAARRVGDFYDIQPALMGISGSDSYGAGESARTDHVTRCMNHIFVQIQGECRIKLFNPRERRARGKRRRTLRHFYDKLVEPDYATMVDSEIRLKDAEVINPNDVLFRLGRKTRTDAKAFEYQNSNTSSQKGEAAGDK